MSNVQQPSQGSGKASWIGFIIGLCLLLFFIFTDPPSTIYTEFNKAGEEVTFQISRAAWLTLGITLLMAIWWATEAIPIPATSLLPVLLIPILGVGTVKVATAPYANEIVFLFLGGFILGLSLQRWNLHKRIALLTLLAVGNKPKAQVAGFMISTAFISMWVSNTATAIMMLPIGLSVIDMLTSSKDDPAEKQRFATAILLGIAYAASIGGIATLIGTPPNAFLAGYLSNTHGITLGFGKWMMLGLPMSIIMLIITWWWLTLKDFRIAGASGDGMSSQQLLRKELADLGSVSRAEKMVSVIFLLTSMAWIFQPLLAKYIPGVNDTTIAIAAAVALFATPTDIKKRIFLMDWKTAKELPWGVLLLFGGGLSLASAIQNSGLSHWIALSVSTGIGSLPILLIIFIVVAVILVLTEVTSNTATAATFIPLMAPLAIAQGLNPMMLAVPTALAASFAFMMPVATPPNAIVFGTGHVKISSMMRNGFFLSIIGIFIVTSFSYFMIGKIWIMTAP